MNILILGGTGAIGKSLVEILSKEKINIYVTTRREIKNKDNIKYIQGNAHDLEFLTKLIKEIQFNAIIDFMMYTFEEFKNRVEILLSNTSQYIFLSSARVYDTIEAPISENTDRLLDVITDKKYLKTSDYPLEKAREENLLIENKKRNWTIVRPYITYNDNRLQLGVYEKEQWLYRVLKDKSVCIQKKILNSKTTLTYGNDVAKYISKLILNNKAYGEVFQIAENLSEITWNDVLNIYKNVLRKNGINMKVEVIENKKFDRWFPSYYAIKYDRSCDRVFNSDKLKKVTKENIKYSNVEKELTRCLNKFLSYIDIKQIELDPRYAGITDKILKNHTKLKEFKSNKNKFKYILSRYTFYYQLKLNKLKTKLLHMK